MINKFIMNFYILVRVLNTEISNHFYMNRKEFNMLNFYYVNNQYVKDFYFLCFRTGVEWGEDIYCFKKPKVIIKRHISPWASGTVNKCFI